MVNNIKHSLGAKSATLLTSLSEDEKKIFTIDDACAILKGKRSNVTKLLHDLEEKKWLMRLERGKYMIIPLEGGILGEYTEHPFYIASELAPEGYIAFWSSLHYYGYTEQVPRTVFIATPKQKKSVKIAGVKYVFVCLKKNQFFGINNIWIEGKKIKISNTEKTIIDCLSHPEYCGGISEVAKTLWETKDILDKDLLLEYTLQIKNGAALKRLLYLMQLLKIEFPIKYDFKLSEGYNSLDPLLPSKGKYNSKFKLIINVSKSDLMSWREF